MGKKMHKVPNARARVVNGEHEMVSVADLITHPSNPRRGDLAAVKASIEVNGFYGTIVAQRSTRYVLAGNHRLMAARELNMGEVPVVWVDCDDTRARAILAADNRTSELGGFDSEALATLLEGLRIEDALVGTGYDQDDISALLAELEPPIEPMAQDQPQDDADGDELVSKWGVFQGGTWRLGRHLLHCGDSTTQAAREAVRSTDCSTLFYDPEWDDAPPMLALNHVLAFTDGARVGDVVNQYGAPTWTFAWDCVTSWYTPNRPLRRMKLCLWYGPLADFDFDGAHYGDAGAKRTVSNTRGSYEFEPDARGKHLSDVFAAPITKLHSGDEHSHSKPLDWIRLLIGCCTTGAVFDPFSGSGVALMACEQLGRSCRAIELNPAHVARTIERWHQSTGQTPEVVS